MIRPQCNYRATPLTVIDQWGTPLMKTRTQGAPRSQTGKSKRWEWKSRRAEALRGSWSLRQQGCFVVVFFTWNYRCMLTFFQQEQLIVFYFAAKVKDKQDDDPGVLISYKTIFQTWGLVLFYPTLPFTNILCIGECHWADWNLVAAHSTKCSNDALKAEKWSIGEESCICLCFIALAEEFRLNPPWWL